MSRRHGAETHGNPDSPLPHHLRHLGMNEQRRAPAAPAYAAGQRWISDMEPQLGIGTVTQAGGKRICVSFQQGACVRQYSVESARLTRVRFNPHDAIRTASGKSATVTQCIEQRGLIVYRTDIGDIPEHELADSLQVGSPFERLLAGFTGKNDAFVLRGRALDLNLSIARNPARGFAGGRIRLLAHQLSIARELCGRHVRRALLADEVGLGKTIEACLVLHRLYATGLASRVLVVVPEPMVHVWFVELLRKFNMVFRIIDEAYLSSVPCEQGRNPFLHEQLVLCSARFLTGDEETQNAAADAGWDLLIADEVHHADPGTPLFGLLARLSAVSRDVLFLTATPRHHGDDALFSRLNLLDPQRYPDRGSFARESARHNAVAGLVGRLLDGTIPGEQDAALLRELAPDAAVTAVPDAESRRRCAAVILDRFGTGRAMFRNTRAVIGGFPPRKVHVWNLAAGRDEVAAISAECASRMPLSPSVPAPEYKYRHDPRTECLAGLVRQLDDEKIILICDGTGKAMAIDKALQHHVTVRTALFHEELTLLQRDRNAAWFSEEDGARLLICSEIGSEGRNFQSAHHLFLWDLPFDPGTIEQRIGRLDRIGQNGTVTIHVPVVRDTPLELMARWYHEGLELFSGISGGNQEVFEQSADALTGLVRLLMRNDPGWRTRLDSLVTRTRALKADVEQRLESGRDRLLEYNTFMPEKTDEIINEVAAVDKDDSVDPVVLDLYRSQGIIVEHTGHRTCTLWPETLTDSSVPGLISSRPVITFDRATALRREDYEFITIDHPSVRGGLDVFFGSEKGTAACVRWPGAPADGLLLEAVFVIECVAPPRLQTERFLAPEPVRIIVGHDGVERADLCTNRSLRHDCVDADGSALMQAPRIRTDVLPAMLKKAEAVAALRCEHIVGKALDAMRALLDAELSRTIHYQQAGSPVHAGGIARAREEIVRLEAAIGAARPRLDAVRLIVCGGAALLPE